MSTPRRLRFVSFQVAWQLAALFALSLFGVFSYGLFVLLSALGVVVAADLSSISRVRSRWRDRLRWAVAIALAGAVIAACVRLVELFGLELLP
ncbi:hypothetical protein [Natrinema marinum]|uniref:hypothetical protein n=1 Tax=Natrinema marinum TaxID=2961598 RepID=UPI0020C9373E|nr:hypothetical protein [Natrinema marinum]